MRRDDNDNDIVSGSVRYNVVDMELINNIQARDDMLRRMAAIDGVHSVRLLVGEPGTHFLSNSCES